MLPLAGLGVLVTRPEAQAAALCGQLEALGATTLCVPAIEIRPHGDPAGIRAALGDLRRFDLVVFVSANAVRFGIGLLDGRQDLTLAAVGPATLRALTAAGHHVAILPAAGFDTEGLLADPRLQDLSGRRVLLVKGVGGRELLEETLVGRGAALATAVVYERQRAAPDAARTQEVLRRCAAGALQVVTATSLEIGASVIAMTDALPALRDCVQGCHWLVPSARVATGLRALGLAAPVLLAQSAEDQALVEALLRWRSSTSGA